MTWGVDEATHTTARSDTTAIVAIGCNPYSLTIAVAGETLSRIRCDRVTTTAAVVVVNART